MTQSHQKQIRLLKFVLRVLYSYALHLSFIITTFSVFQILPITETEDLPPPSEPPLILARGKNRLRTTTTTPRRAAATATAAATTRGQKAERADST